MDLMLYRGCTTPVRLPAYEAASLAVLKKLGVNLVEMEDANCCGAQYVEFMDKRAFTAMSGRILALAERAGYDILALCGACSGSLKTTKHLLDTDIRARDEVNSLLIEEGLKYTGKVRVRHILQVLAEDIGYDAIERAVVKPLVEAVGGTAVDYPGKTRCCGGPLLGMDEEVAGKIGLDKIDNIAGVGAMGIVTACVFCGVQLTQVQFGDKAGNRTKIPIIPIPQFIGPAIGVDEDVLGFELNKIDAKAVLDCCGVKI
jgi:heterodisulfide reductase subunit B